MNDDDRRHFGRMLLLLSLIALLWNTTSAEDPSSQLSNMTLRQDISAESRYTIKGREEAFDRKNKYLKKTTRRLCTLPPAVIDRPGWNSMGKTI